MPLLSDSADFSSDGASPSPYGMPPGLESELRRETPSHARRTWKAYHERQALVAEHRQLSRPVSIDPVLWGDLLSGKLAELIEGERNHPRTIVSGGAADRDGGHCLLPELDDAGFQSGHDRAVAAAVGKPKVLRFSAEGSEYTADDFGAGGEFNDMYERRYTGFDGLTKEARGQAAERAWSRAGRPGDSAVVKSHRERRMRQRISCEAQSIPWEPGTTEAASAATPGTPSGGGRGGGNQENGRSSRGGVGGSRGSGGGSGLAGNFGSDLFAGEAATTLAARHDKRGQQQGFDLQAHASPHIGPDSHCLIAEEVEEVHKLRDEERTDGSNASLATQMQHRLVPIGGGAGGTRKLRGTAALERQELARIVLKDRYGEEAVRRNRVAFTGDHDGGGGDDDDDDDSDNKANSSTCSVTTFETFYTRVTTATDALPTVERGLNEEQPDAEQHAVIPEEAAVSSSLVALEQEQRREERTAERRAERIAKLEAKRNRAKRSAATLYSNGSEAPRSTLPLQHIEGGDGGSRGSGFVGTSDEISIAPSMSSLGSFDEQSGSAPPLALQQAQVADTTDRPLPAVLHLPRVLDHTASKSQHAIRRRSRRSIPLALPSSATAGAVVEVGSACYFPPTDRDFDASVERVVRREQERSSSRLGIAFGGAGKRRRSRRLSRSSRSSSAVGIGLADSALAAAPDQDGQGKSFASSSGRAIGAAGVPASSTTTAVSTAALVKRKINWWRSRSKPPPKVPHRSRALTKLAGEDGLSRGATSSSAPSYSRRNSGCGDGRSAREGSTVSMAPSASSAIGSEPHHQLPAARAGVADDEQSLAGSVTSSLTSLGGSARCHVSVEPLAETDSSVSSFASTSLASGSRALVGGHSVADPAATTKLAATEAPLAGLAGAGARVGVASPRAAAGGGGAGGGTLGRLDSEERSKSRKKWHGRGGTGAVQRVHKIKLGSTRHQKSMQSAERTALLIGACEWGDLEALERLLELGASPLDPYSPCGESRCVFCQFFLFVLQVGAGLKPRLASDDTLHTRALAKLIEAGLEDNPLFLSLPKLRDQDDRGFCLLHHAAAFGNASKVEFLLERGVDPDVRARGHDETALLIAARRGQRLHLRVAAALIRSGANILARDRRGMTALHHAADVGRKHMCHYLLLVGADKTVQDNEGRTPLDLCHGKHPRASAVLRSFAGCKPPPATILNYMEKVEVHGLDHSTAQELVLQEQRSREDAEASEAAAAAASAADPAGAADVILGDDDKSMASWDAASLGGMSGDGASVLSLGSLATPVRRGR